AAIDGSLATLDIDYIDLMLIHSPQPWNDFRGGDYAAGNRAAWRALEEAHQAGKIRAIGVSNFQQHDLENILETCTVAQQVNQILVHAGKTPSEQNTYCHRKNIRVKEHSPIAQGAIIQNPQIQKMAERYRVSVPQLCIRYMLQLDTVSQPKNANPDHMRSNAQVDFEISDDDMVTLRDLEDVDYGERSAFPVYSGQ